MKPISLGALALAPGVALPPQTADRGLPPPHLRQTEESTREPKEESTREPKEASAKGIIPITPTFVDKSEGIVQTHIVL